MRYLGSFKIFAESELVPGLDLDLAGSYETGFFPDDSNREQWPIPNVLGVVREEPVAQSR